MRAVEEDGVSIYLERATMDAIVTEALINLWVEAMESIVTTTGARHFGPNELGLGPKLDKTGSEVVIF